MKGSMGEMDFYLTLWSLGEAAKNISYSEELEGYQEGELPAELRSQRRINWGRVRNEIVPYLTQVSDHFFSCLTVEVVTISGETEICYESEGDFGSVLLDGSEILRALDGQHRLVAIKEAVKESPALAAEKISVILVPYRGVQRSQQLFSDLNRNAKPTTKAINVLFEWRGLFEQAAKKAIEVSRVLDDRVELEKNSLAQKSNRFITLGVLYEVSKTILENRNGYDSYKNTEPPQEIIDKASREVAMIFDEVLLQALPDFEKVVAKKMTPYEYRSKYIATHSVGIQSIAIAIRETMDQRPDDWKELCINKLKSVDWRTKNKEWEGTVVSGGLVANRKTNMRLLAAQLKEFIGLDLKESELEYFSPDRAFPIRRLSAKRG